MVKCMICGNEYDDNKCYGVGLQGRICRKCFDKKYYPNSTKYGRLTKKK